MALLFLGDIATAQPVLMIGDSIFALSRGVPNHLRSAGYEIEDLSITGAKVSDIATQYRDQNDHQSVVVMNGGGNDILSGHLVDCIKMNDKCEAVVQQVLSTAQQLVQQMESDGVQKVIYVGFYHPRGIYSGLIPAIDSGVLQIKEYCEAISICEYIDTRDFMMPEDIWWDQLHPSASGREKIGQAIVSSLSRHGFLPI